MKTYIGFSRDHSGSMRSIARAAARDYNSKISTIKEAALATNQDTIVSVVECGYGDTDSVRRVVTNSTVNSLTPLAESAYQADGRGTPLWDSVGELIEMFESTPDANNKDVSFLVMAITDGDENCSRKYSADKLARKIKELNATDRWTFVFRVPRGHSRKIAQKLGISEGNIQEWDQNDKAVEIAARHDAEAFTQYFTSRSLGQTSTQKFYANLQNVSAKDVAAVMTDISGEVMIWPVSPADEGTEIRPFIETRLKRSMLKGAGFYQLTKTEPEVQDYKKILIRDKTSQAIYYGAAAKQLLGLPSYGTIRLAPGNHGNFDIFIQSTSVNRKLKKGTSLIYWENVGVRYKEGPSSI